MSDFILFKCSGGFGQLLAQTHLIFYWPFIILFIWAIKQSAYFKHTDGQATAFLQKRTERKSNNLYELSSVWAHLDISEHLVCLLCPTWALSNRSHFLLPQEHPIQVSLQWLFQNLPWGHWMLVMSYKGWSLLTYSYYNVYHQTAPPWHCHALKVNLLAPEQFLYSVLLRSQSN